MTGLFLAARIRSLLPGLERLRRAVLARGRPDDIHDLRVLTRRLRAALRAARLFLRRRDVTEALAALRQLGRALGPVRAIDVALEDLGDHPERPALERRRTRAHAALRLRSPAANLRRVAARLPSASLRPDAAPRVRSWALRTLRPASKAALHRLRIEVKKCRYLLETLRAPAPLARLQRLQRELGRAHDLETLRRFLRKPPAWIAPRERAHVAAARRLIASTAGAARRQLQKSAAELE